MKYSLIVAMTGLLCSAIAHAESRTFTNTAGKTIQAELVAVEADNATLKLGNGRMTKVPLITLSEADQSFIKTWWEANKNKINASDVRLKIEKKTRRLDTADDKDKGGKKKMSKDEAGYSCVLENYSKKSISEISVAYTIYKRVSTRGKDGSENSTEEITGTSTIPALEPRGTGTFETDKVVCEDSSQKGGKEESTSRRESVVGLVVTLSIGGEEFLKQSLPENFLERLTEEAERKAKDDD